MTITIDLPQAILDQVRAEAEAKGKDVETFVRETLQAKMLRRKLTFAKVAQPIQDAIAAAGMTPEEGETFFETEVLNSRKRHQPSQP